MFIYKDAPSPLFKVLLNLKLSYCNIRLYFYVKYQNQYFYGHFLCALINIASWIILISEYL